MTTIARTPEQTTEVFKHYFNLGDIDALIGAYYAPGAVLAAAPGRATAGSDLRIALAKYFELRGKMTATTRHVLASGDTALLVIGWTVDARGADGKPLTVRGTSTDVVRRQADGSWRCVIDNPHNIA